MMHAKKINTKTPTIMFPAKLPPWYGSVSSVGSVVLVVVKLTAESTMEVESPRRLFMVCDQLVYVELY
jgi:hypothetical protein